MLSVLSAKQFYLHSVLFLIATLLSELIYNKFKLKKKKKKKKKKITSYNNSTI